MLTRLGLSVPGTRYLAVHKPLDQLSCTPVLIGPCFRPKRPGESFLFFPGLFGVFAEIAT